MDIEGLGDVLVETLVDKGMVKDVADIYKLTVDDISNLERKAEKSATKLIEQIDASKTRGLERLLYGIDIRHVGERTAKILAKHARSIDKLSRATVEELQAIHEIGPIVAISVFEWFQNPLHLELVNRLTGRWSENGVGRRRNNRGREICRKNFRTDRDARRIYTGRGKQAYRTTRRQSVVVGKQENGFCRCRERRRVQID